MSYRWNAEAGRYRDANGRFVSRAAVRRSLDQALSRIERDMVSAARSFRAGSIGVRDFERVMREGIKDSHVLATALARGGTAQLTAADYGRIGGRVRVQYVYLERWLGEIAAGRATYDGRFPVRAGMYANASRGLYYDVVAEIEADRGMEEEQNVLMPGENCPGCLAEKARGWVAIGQLVPIGMRTCLGNCRCRIEYR